jgi:tRNA-splicing ligase RtcB
MITTPMTFCASVNVIEHVGKAGPSRCGSGHADHRSGLCGVIGDATHQPALIAQARVLGLHGMSRDAWKCYSVEGSWYHDVVAPGYKYNYDRYPGRRRTGATETAGSMSAPGYVVQGLGNPDSISSAAHGAGRQMSRGEAFRKFDWTSVRHSLKAKGVEVLSAGLDESPGAYKDIRRVMADQADLVRVVAEFQPKLVKMAGGRDKPED